VAATRDRIASGMDAAARPTMHYVQACHSRMQEVVGSSRASVVAFNLGYLPFSDKSVVTTAATTLAALEAALEVSQRARGLCGSPVQWGLPLPVHMRTAWRRGGSSNEQDDDASRRHETGNRYAMCGFRVLLAYELCLTLWARLMHGSGWAPRCVFPR
jgi:hypothetical protein